MDAGILNGGCNHFFQKKSNGAQEPVHSQVPVSAKIRRGSQGYPKASPALCDENPDLGYMPICLAIDNSYL